MLATAYLARSSRPDAERDALEAALAGAFAAARARWPDLAFDDEAMAGELGELDSGTLPAFLVELVLARACLSGDAAALRHFHGEMFARVDRVLARLGVSEPDADDVKQDVRAKLLVGTTGEPKLALYQGTGPLAAWVASTAGRQALGLLRRRKPHDPLDDDELLDATDDPELAVLKTRHHADVKQAFQAAVAELAPRDRAVLRALIVDDRSVNDIAAVYGIHRVTASRWVSEIRHALLAGTRKRLATALQLDAPSLDSALRLIDSTLELSLYRLLA